MESKNKKKAPCLAVFGTGSDVGKSIVVTALCRCFVNMGLKVAPYKAQNMSNNSGVTPEGLEMGRAQIVQAEACRIPPHVDMNPVLLKPTSDVGSQVVVLGKVLENSTASEYHRKKEALFTSSMAALDRLREENDLVVIEGAGSCAEVNLMPHDIVNFRVAEYSGADVILVADIHRGGVFAQFVGTLSCLPEKNADQVCGMIVNRFRGDLSLFEEGVKWIEERTGKDVFGVLPWFSHFHIEAEDSVVIENVGAQPLDEGKPAIAVIRLPHIANFTDIDPLMKLEAVSTVFVDKLCDLSKFCAVIIPGSKNTRHDLAWLKTSGWFDEIKDFAEAGGNVLGICGGFQMMGTVVRDPHGHEGAAGDTEGLALLPAETVLKAPKTTTLSRFNWGDTVGLGYEIHMGETIVHDGRALFSVTQRNGVPEKSLEGCISDDKRCMGTYMHGLFDQGGVLEKWLAGVGVDISGMGEACSLSSRDRDYDLLAEHFLAHMDFEKIRSCVFDKNQDS